MKKFMLLSCAMLAGVSALGLASCGKESTEDIAIVKFMSHTSLNEIESSIKKEIKKEDSSIKVKCYNTNAKQDQITSTLASLKKKKVGTVVCIATPVAATAKGTFAGTDTKIIFSAVSDPVSSEIVSNLESPEGNITGTSDAVDLEKQIELAYTVDPALKKIGYIYTGSESNSVANCNRLKTLSSEKGYTLVEKQISNSADIKTVFDSIKDDIDALIVTDDNNVAGVMNTLSYECVKAKVPCYCAADSEIKDGGMMGYSINYTKLGEDTAKMAVEAHNGKAIKDIPVKVYSSSELKLYYNSGFVRTSGITIPASLLANATDLA